MSSKKILLPETGIKERTKSRKPRSENQERRPRQARSGNTRTLPTTIDARQRSEAIGLVLVGVSAFSLSLIHYLSSSQIPGLINTFMVYFGMGVYILPVMIGMLGIQRFMERPFTNIGWRMAGIFGTMMFGLGLLGLEGGKIGVYSLDMFARIFGPVPSKILFAFLLLSSMIFSLDILYKDLLAAALILASLTTRFIFFCWNVTLSLLSMIIGAVKTTADLLAAIYGRVRQFFSEQNIDPAAQLGKLLSFKPRVATEHVGELEDLEDLVEDDEPVVTNKSAAVALNEEEATVIPVPRHWQDNNECQADVKTAPVEAACQFQVSHIANHCVIVDAGNGGVLTTPPPHREIDAEGEDDLQVIVRLEDDDEENADECEYDEESADCDEEVKTVHKPVSAKVSRETDTDEEPVYLEDNRIDQEIKTDKFASQPAKPVKFAEALLPPIDILKMPPPRDNQESKSDLSQRSAFLIKTLDEFGIKATVIDIVEGPAVSRFEIKPAPGVKVSRITTLIDDIALALAAPAIRIEAPIPGKSALGIEIPNTKPTPVYFYDLLKNENFGRNQIPLNLALGVTINGKPVFADLSEMPHLLIAGSTGSGKSVCVNTIIASILFQARADQVKFVMIDPKMVELSSYNGIPHLIAPVVTDPAKASAALMWAVEEMTRRYEILAGCGCKKISTYNEELERLKQEVDQDLEPMPFIVIVIDELADLMMTASAEVEGSICRLAQMARAVGMHLVIATQRPSVNVLTGLIKANLPTRIAFSVTSAVDSRTILDAKGAERLLGKGDMLFIPKGRNKPLRLQGAFVSDRELMDLIEFVKKQGQPEYMDIAPTQSDDDEDDCSEEEAGGDADSPLIQQILKYLETQEKTSTSMLQRKFRIGYNRAARIMDQLEEKGLVSPMDGANKRRVLIGRSNTQV
ncbi:MAG: hypothetical protein CVV41_00565 [Candidatus Riflebacteria bacterium HGW-Riflebacteria-1]|jgi:ribosomal protein S25|nr:MAG: hypothetical protein CVV41_00565 [Candidatus Riflebacteria bacterium HGW-Riflebacteria-1]